MGDDVLTPEEQTVRSATLDVGQMKSAPLSLHVHSLSHVRRSLLDTVLQHVHYGLSKEEERSALAFEVMELVADLARLPALEMCGISPSMFPPHVL